MTTAAAFPDVAADMERRRRDGSSAQLGFTYTDPGTATNVASSFPWAASIIVVAHAYLPDAGTPQRRSGAARVARFAERDHYLPLRETLDGLAVRLRADGHRAAVLCDDRRLVDRAAAVRAGVGWWGKNAMVLVPGSGPWVLLGSVVTDADLEPDEPMARDCGNCSACLPACPTGALVAPGLLDARRCLAAVLQGPGTIPRRLRGAVEDRLYGCDDCLDACPPGTRLVGRSTEDRRAVDVVDILSASDAQLLREHEHFFIPGRRVRYLRRNALVVLGNSAVTTVGASMVVGFLGHPDPLLRLHSAWAAGRIGGPLMGAALETGWRSERAADVRAEMALAMAGQ